MTILVIEDNQKHLNDAEDFFSSKDVEVVYAKDYLSAKEYLQKGKVDGVISDIYFPYSNENLPNEEAVGVTVMMLCCDRKIPCVLNTAGYHHGNRYQWICELLDELRLPRMVDASFDHHKEAETKDWKNAYLTLSYLIEVGECKEHQKNHFHIDGSAEDPAHSIWNFNRWFKQEWEKS